MTCTNIRLDLGGAAASWLGTAVPFSFLGQCKMQNNPKLDLRISGLELLLMEHARHIVALQKEKEMELMAVATEMSSEYSDIKNRVKNAGQGAQFSVRKL